MTAYQPLAVESGARLPIRRDERVDPDDPTSMALPVIGDTVLLTDGITGRVSGRLRRVAGPDVWRVEATTGATRYVRIDEIAGYPEDNSPTRPEWEAEADDITPERASFKVGDRVVPVGNYRPTTLVREGGGVVANTSFIEHHPIRVEDRSGAGYLFRTDELALAGDWETAR